MKTRKRKNGRTRRSSRGCRKRSSEWRFSFSFWEERHRPPLSPRAISCVSGATTEPCRVSRIPLRRRGLAERVVAVEGRGPVPWSTEPNARLLARRHAVADAQRRLLYLLYELRYGLPQGIDSIAWRGMWSWGISTRRGRTNRVLGGCGTAPAAFSRGLCDLEGPRQVIPCRGRELCGGEGD